MEKEVKIIEDRQEIRLILIEAYNSLVKKNMADVDGFVDCMDLGSVIKTMGHVLIKRKMSDRLADYQETFETKLVAKGSGTIRMVRLLINEIDESNNITEETIVRNEIPGDNDSLSSLDNSKVFTSNGILITKKDMKEAYAKLSPLPPLNFRDFDKFRQIICEQMGTQLSDEDLKKALMELCPETVFFSQPYQSKQGDDEIVIVPCAFRAKELKIVKSPQEENCKKQMQSPTRLISGMTKDLMRLVYNSLDDLTNQYHDFSLFHQKLEKEFGKSIVIEDLISDVKVRCADVKFWKKMPYENNGKTTFIRVAFKSKSLSKKKSALSEFYDFAFFQSRGNNKDGLQQAIDQLAKKALPENWHYGNDQKDNGTHPILKNYLVQTFQRLRAEDADNNNNAKWENKVRISNDGKEAVFNTGLVDIIYEPIYAYFERNSRRNAQPWVFKAFVGSRDSLMQTLTRSFGAKLPDPAHYYNDTSELVYDIKSSIGSTNWDHILNRCDRLPIEFLEDNVTNFDFQQPKTPAFYRQLAKHIIDNPRSFNRIKNRIEDAIDYAIKRVRWNFKTAIPIYYPGQQQISLLLPLSLLKEGQIDIALVLEATDTGAYIAHTILSLQMAYINARLITRPDSDWLTAEAIAPKNDLIEEEVDD